MQGFVMQVVGGKFFMCKKVGNVGLFRALWEAERRLCVFFMGEKVNISLFYYIYTTV